MNVRNMMSVAVVSMIVLVIHGNAVAGDASRCVGDWSSAVNGLKGRCVLSTSAVGEHSDLAIFLELRNEGKDNLTLDPGNPFWESAELLGPDKRPVAPAKRVSGVWLSANKASLPRDCYLGFPVSRRHVGGFGQVAVGILAWKNLSPGKYTLRLKYSVAPKDEKENERQLALQKGEWRGTLVIPPVKIQIVGE